MYAFWQQASTQWLGLRAGVHVRRFHDRRAGVVALDSAVRASDRSARHLAAARRGARAAGRSVRARHGAVDAQKMADAHGVLGRRRPRLARSFRSARWGPEPDDTLFHSALEARRPPSANVPTELLVKSERIDIRTPYKPSFPEGSIGDHRSMAVIIRLPDGIEKNTTDGLVVILEGLHARGMSGGAVSRGRSPAALSVSSIGVRRRGWREGARRSGGSPASAIADRRHRRRLLRAKGDFPEPIGPGFWERS